MNKPAVIQKISFGDVTLVPLHIVGTSSYVEQVVQVAGEFGRVCSSETGSWWWLEIKPNYDVEEVKRYIRSLELEDDQSERT